MKAKFMRPPKLKPRPTRKRQRLASACSPNKRKNLGESIPIPPKQSPVVILKPSTKLLICDGNEQKAGLQKPVQHRRPRRMAEDEDYIPKDQDSDEDFFPEGHDEPQFCDLCGAQHTEPLKPIPNRDGLFACQHCMPRRRRVRQPGTIVTDDDENDVIVMRAHHHRRGKRSRENNIVPAKFLAYVIKQERDREIFMTCQYCGWRKTYRSSLSRSKARPDLWICNSCRRCENKLGGLHPRHHPQRRQADKQKRTSDRGIRFYASGELMYEPIVTEQSIMPGKLDRKKIMETQFKIHNINPRTQECIRPELLEEVRKNRPLWPSRPLAKQKFFKNCEHRRSNEPLFATPDLEAADDLEEVDDLPFTATTPCPALELEMPDGPPALID